MKKIWNLIAVALLGIFLIGCGTTGRTGNAIRTGGTINNPDGSFEQVWTEHVRDQFGREMVVVKGKTTKSVYNPRTKKYEVQTTTVVEGSTGGRTLEADAVAGFVSNIPNAAGDMLAATILKGANWGTTIDNSGANVTNVAVQNTNKQKQGQKMKQKQGQLQGQAQGQIAQGGQGGQGGTGGNGGNGGNGGSGGNGGNNGNKGDKPGHGYGDKNHDHTGPPGQQ